MPTFRELLNQTALSVLDQNQQSTISQVQDKMLENSLVQVRKEITSLEVAIQTQELAHNPLLETKDQLKVKKAMEIEIKQEIQRRNLAKVPQQLIKDFFGVQED